MAEVMTTTLNKRTIVEIADDGDSETLPSELHAAFHLKGNLANHIALSDGSMVFSTQVVKKIKGECNYWEYVCRDGNKQYCTICKHSATVVDGKLSNMIKHQLPKWMQRTSFLLNWEAQNYQQLFLYMKS